MRLPGYYFIFFFLTASSPLLGQKIDGTYYGEILSPKNTMVLKSKDGHVQGLIYFNEKDTISLRGTYLNATFKSTIRLKDSREILIEGQVKKTAMWLRVLPDTVKRFLNKVSSKENYSISKMYRENLDPMLLGRWEFVKSVDINGVTSTEGRVAVIYLDNNRKNTQLLSIPAGINRGGKVSDTQLLAQKVEDSWETTGNVLTEESITLSGHLPTRVRKYEIRQDTLITYPISRSESYTVYIKK